MVKDGNKSTEFRKEEQNTNRNLVTEKEKFRKFSSDFSATKQKWNNKKKDGKFIKKKREKRQRREEK